jgi:filamentous hemagglutinin
LAIDLFEDGDAPRHVRDRGADSRRRSHVDPAALAVLADPERRAAESRAYRVLVERTYREADGARAPQAPELAEVRARHAEVFDRIEATQEPRDIGSVLPKSFNLSVPSGGKVWVAPNATKHIWEETRGLTFGRSISQEQRLAGLAGAVDGATVRNWEQVQVSRGWELIFSRPRKAGGNPVLKHARYTGGDGS